MWARPPADFAYPLRPFIPPHPSHPSETKRARMFLLCIYIYIHTRHKQSKFLRNFDFHAGFGPRDYENRDPRPNFVQNAPAKIDFH